MRFDFLFFSVYLCDKLPDMKLYIIIVIPGKRRHQKVIGCRTREVAAEMHPVIGWPGLLAIHHYFYVGRPAT
jgi:hypothetical protein